MTRKIFLGLIGAIAAGSRVVRSEPGPNPVVAISDCPSERFIPGTRVFLDGVDVSHDCYAAEVRADGTGTVGWYARNAAGKYCWDETQQPIDLVRYQKTGRVRIVPPRHITPEQWAALQRKWLCV